MPAKKSAPSKPTYAVMVQESIKALGDRTGSSVQAITKQLQSEYRTDVNKPALLKAIKKGVADGDLVQIKASYKVSKKAPAAKVKKAPATKKKTASKKEAPTSTVKKVSAVKPGMKPKKSITKKSTKRTTTTTTKKPTTKKPAPKKTTTTKKKVATKK